MNRIIKPTLFALGLTIAMAASAVAQTAQDLVGTWAHVENVNVRPDGTRNEAFGSNAKGLAVFTSNGRFSIFLHRPDLPKFAANNRVQGTPEENKAVIQGMIAFYGTYTVANKVLMLKVEGSSFPNWVGTDQVRPLGMFTGDEMTFLGLAGSAGGQNTARFKRLK